MLGEAMERHYGGCLCYGPPIEEGFYYDMAIDDRQVSSNDFSSLCLLYTSPSPRDGLLSRMPSSA